jgi:hypothetical protein
VSGQRGAYAKLHRHTKKTLEVQQKKLNLAKVKERARAKELECDAPLLAEESKIMMAKECEAPLLAEESKIMMADLSALDPARRSWFESKQAMICARDV